MSREAAKPGQEWIFGDAGRTTPAPVPARSRDRRTRHRGGLLGRLVGFAFWSICFLAATACLAAFASGLLRDGNFGDAEVALDLAASSDWRSAEFRAWVPGRYLLYLTSRDPNDGSTEREFGGRIYVRVIEPDGRAPVDERFEPPTLDHRLRGGIEWTRVGEFYVNASSWEPWRLSVRVATPDSEFVGVPASVVLRRQKAMPELAGLLNYAVAVPAVVLFALSLPAAFGLPRRGGTWIPALLSIAGLATMGWLATLVR